MCGRTSRVWGTQRTPTRTSDSRKSKATGHFRAEASSGKVCWFLRTFGLWGGVLMMPGFSFLTTLIAGLGAWVFVLCPVR